MYRNLFHHWISVTPCRHRPTGQMTKTLSKIIISLLWSTLLFNSRMTCAFHSICNGDDLDLGFVFFILIPIKWFHKRMARQTLLLHSGKVTGVLEKIKSHLGKMTLYLWHHQPCHIQSHLDHIFSLFWCLVWTSESRLDHVYMAACIELPPCDWLIRYLH